MFIDCEYFMLEVYCVRKTEERGDEECAGALLIIFCHSTMHVYSGTPLFWIPLGQFKVS